MRTLRSMLLSMQRLLEKARHGIALGALTAALGLLGAVTTGCETDGEDKVYYGPAPYDTVDASADVPVETSPYPDAVYYGPPPTDVQTDQPNVYYGPPPTDVAPEAMDTLYGPPPADVSPDQPVVYYGPPPTDVVQDQVPDKVEPEVVPLYGPPPVDVVQDAPPPDAAPDCGNIALYGPPPCTSDAECQTDYGPNWYCDKSDPCFNLCKPKG